MVWQTVERERSPKSYTPCTSYLIFPQQKGKGFLTIRWERSGKYDDVGRKWAIMKKGRRPLSSLLSVLYVMGLVLRVISFSLLSVCPSLLHSWSLKNWHPPRIYIQIRTWVAQNEAECLNDKYKNVWSEKTVRWWRQMTHDRRIGKIPTTANTCESKYYMSDSCNHQKPMKY